MTTEENETGRTIDILSTNLAKIEELSQRLIAALANKTPSDHGLQGPGQDLFIKAASAYMNDMMANPAKIIEQQVSYWGKTLSQYIEAQNASLSDEVAEKTDSAPDKRFENPLWASNPYFSFIKQQYLTNKEAVETTIANLDELEEGDKKRAEFFSHQIMDMFSPTNFLATNPDALALAVETEGQSLVDGLENLVHDVESNNGEFVVTLANKNAFKVGENLATTKGSVVFRNRMFELIQYAPTTETVHKTPLIIFPPWINRFYIMDLKEKNSLIKWIVEQGYTLFVVSWINPNASYADVGIDDYVTEGYLTAIDQVKQITGEKKVNAVGYCIGGTVLSLTLALMKKQRDPSINSATFFTTLTDFEDQGEVGVFLDDDFLDGIEREVKEKGILHTVFMSRTFSYLRSNDLIYAPAVRSYMMGKAPPAFDLLFWNGDGTNLPARMVIQYLLDLCRDNKFAKGEFEILGKKLLLKDVGVPLCAIACETDHIAAWKSCYDGVAQMGSKDKTFIVSQSGHIAGIINPPSKKKYGHFTNPDLGLTHDDWKDTADFNEGSWWPRWENWLSGKSGKQVPARKAGDSKHPVLGPAPGSYVIS